MTFAVASLPSSEAVSVEGLAEGCIGRTIMGGLKNLDGAFGGKNLNLSSIKRTGTFQVPVQSLADYRRKEGKDGVSLMNMN